MRTNILILLLTALTSLSNAAPSYHYNLDVADVRLEATPFGQQLTCPGGSPLLLGTSVSLPAIPVRLVVPADFEPSGLTVLPGPARLWGVLNIVPSNSNGRILGHDGTTVESVETIQPLPTGEIPEVVAEISSCGWLMGAKVVDLLLYPVRYNTTTSQVTVYTNLDITIDGSSTGLVPLPSYASRRVISAQRRTLSKTVQNPADLDQFFSPPFELSSPDHLPSRDFTNEKEYAESEALEYVIITSKDLIEAFEPLIASKRARGILAETVLIDEISAAYPAGDLAESIRDYLIDMRRLRGLNWALLGGDVEIVPTRIVKTSKWDRLTATDAYYSCLDGDWNSNHNAEIGDQVWSWDESDNMDLLPDLWVGRAPVRNTEEASVFVSKALEYQVNFTETDYRNRVLAIETSAFSLGDSKGACGWVIRKLPSAIDTVRLNYASTPPLNSVNAVNAMNRGSAIVFGYGHGHEFLLTCGDLDTDSEPDVDNRGVLTRADFAGLTNLNRYGLFMSLSCEVAMFNSDCVAEAWMRNPHGGGIAFIGSSTYDIPSISLSFFWQPLFEMLNEGDTYCMGELLGRCKIDNASMSQRYGAYRTIFMGYNMLGDPESMLSLDRPRQMSLFAPEHYIAGEINSAGLSVKDAVTSREVPHLTLGISTPEKLIYSTSSDSSGRLEPGSIFPQEAGVGRIFITAPNYLPIVDSIPFISGHNHPTISFTNFVDLSGNVRNEKIDAGESFDLFLSIYNSNAETRPATLCSLSSTSGYVAIHNNSTHFPILPSNATVSSQTPFRLKVDPVTPDSTIITLTFTFSADSESWDETKDYLVHAPYLLPLYVNYTELNGSGDGDNLPDAEEPFTLGVTLQNVGSGATAGLNRGRISSSDPGVLQISGAYSFQDIGGAGEISATETCTLLFGNFGARTDSTILFTLAVTDTFDRSWSFDLKLPLFRTLDTTSVWYQPFDFDGIQLKWKPLNDTNLVGYNLYRTSSHGGKEVRVNPQLLRGGSRYTDQRVTSRESYDYVVSSVVDQFELRFGWLKSVSLSHRSASGSPFSIGFSQPTGLAVTRLTTRSDLQIFVGTLDGKLHSACLTNGSVMKTSAELQLDQNVTPTWISPITVANLDNDPALELVTAVRTDNAQDPGYLLILENAGQEEHLQIEYQIPIPQQDYSSVYARPSVSDVNDDGQPEILLVYSNGKFGAGYSGLIMYTFDGASWTPRKLGRAEHAGYNYSDVAIGKPDGRNVWCYYGTGIQNDSELGGGRCVKGIKADSTLSWTYPPSGKLNSYVNRLALGDVNGDGSLELVFITINLEIHVLTIDPNSADTLGTDVEWWRPRYNSLLTDLEPNGITGLSLGNILNESPGLEIVTSSPETLYVFSQTGEILVRAVRNDNLNENLCTTPLIADVDDDGDMDIVLPNGHHQIEAWDGQTGEPLDHWPIVVNDRFNDYALTDFDKDGELELIVLTEGGLINVFDIGKTGKVEWGQMNHDLWRTNCYDFVVPINSGPELELPTEYGLSAYPNPFNSTIQFGYEIPIAGKISLKIYDVTGREVASLVQGQQRAGFHKIAWQGVNQSGLPLSSGIYFIRLEAGQFVKSQKMTLVK